MKINYLKSFLFLLILMTISGLIGYGVMNYKNFNKFYKLGYFDGKGDLAYDLTSIVGLKVDKNNFDETKYKPLFSYMTTDFYIYQDGEFKTIVIYE